MTTLQRPVILLATGSYNPITNMHLRMFELARDHLHDIGFKVLGGIISPVHDAYSKNKPTLISASHRLKMVELAIENNSFLRLSKFETEQEGWSRTRFVLEQHQELVRKFCHGELKQPGWIPDEASALVDKSTNKDYPQIIYLCGADLLESFAVPGLWLDTDIEAIVKNFGLVVIGRAGSNAESFIDRRDVLSTNRNNIRIVTDQVPNLISSTAIRKLISIGHSVRYLCPDDTIEYILENRLYVEN